MVPERDKMASTSSGEGVTHRRHLPALSCAGCAAGGNVLGALGGIAHRYCPWHREQWALCLCATLSKQAIDRTMRQGWTSLCPLERREVGGGNGEEDGREDGRERGALTGPGRGLT